MPNGTKPLGNNFDITKDISMNTNKKIIIGTLMGCIFGATVGYSASVVSLPHTFTAGTPIKASEVNANFAALSQEISNLKSTANFSKSTIFSESVLTPITAAVGSTVTVGGKSFEIKQKVAIEDPITGKKYTLNYPIGTEGNVSIRVLSCDAGISDNAQVIRLGYGNGFTSYVYLHSFASDLISSFYTGIDIALSKNVCASFTVERFFESIPTYTVPTSMINRAEELQKYISVKEI